jgi:hypothetical protein
MFVEAILSVCLMTPINDWKGDLSTGPTCVHMNTGGRKFPVYNPRDLPTVMEQCMMWNSQGVYEVQTREHYEAILKKLGHATGAKGMLKAECRLHQYEQPFKCRDCES